MINQIKNNRNYLPRLMWNRPIDQFFGEVLSDLWDEEMQPIIHSVNVKETRQYYSIQLTAPGMKKEDFKIELEGNFLTVSCEKEIHIEKDPKGTLQRKEYKYVSFSRSFTLPDDVDVENVSARHEDGLLIVRIYKRLEPQRLTR